MDIFIIILAIVFSAFFSGAETIYLSASKIRLEVLFRSRNKEIKKISSFLKDPENFIATTLVGNNFANVVFSSLIIIILKDFLGGISVVLISTTFLLIFAEIIPKSIGRQYANNLIIPVAKILNLFRIIFNPINYLLTWVSNYLLRRFKLSNDHKVEHRLTRKDIRRFIHESEKNGIIASSERDIINRIFDLRKTRLKEIMIPRTEIFAVSKDVDIHDLIYKFDESGFSRIPVYEEKIDNIIGVILAKDLFVKNYKKEDIIKEILFVPETKIAYALLKEFRQKNISIAVVLDEYGGTAGVITLEDLIEELFGEILDEHDFDHHHFYKYINESTLSVDARAEVDEINEKYNLQIPTGNYITIAGFIIDRLGHIPKRGEIIEFGKLKIVVQRANRKCVIRVYINSQRIN